MPRSGKRVAIHKPRAFSVVFDVPEGYFVWALAHVHANRVYTTDIHAPVNWQCILQHVNGGQPIAAYAETAQQAIDIACLRARATPAPGVVVLPHRPIAGPARPERQALMKRGNKLLDEIEGIVAGGHRLLGDADTGEDT